MKIIKNMVWGLIPARGGSKSIPLKNMSILNGRPLIDYVIKAGKQSRYISRLICSTDHEEIAKYCFKKGVEVQKRPQELSQDDTSTLDVIIWFLKEFSKMNTIAEMIVLLEPTSPFVIPEHIDKCIELLMLTPEADSAQTITPVSPNNHAYNQRYIKDGYVLFKFPHERKKYYNKQLKPLFYVHGNVRVFRSMSVLKKEDIYGDLCIPVIIPVFYALDVDCYEDLKIAECFIKCGLVDLP